jgi:trehalose 6-phosphate synthase/phosphatase
MNLVAKEYLASKKDNAGVLVLSEMAGAAKELGEAVIVNPNGIEEMANGLKTALEMPLQEQVERNRAMRHRLERYDIVRWGRDFADELFRVKQDQGRYNSRLLDDKARDRLIQDYDGSNRRCFLLDYDGTLTPFKDSPIMARPSNELIEKLARLSEDSRNSLYLVSSRDRNILQEWFGPLKIGLAAEYGVWLRDKDGHWQLTRNLAKDWKEKILPILNGYTDRVPGSFVEEKEYSLTWHYRRADPQVSAVRVRELVDELSDFLRNTDLQVIQHSKVVEVKNAGISKGTTARSIVTSIRPDFTLAIGDASVDEEMFSVLSENAYTIRVGLVDSSARYNVRNSNEVVQLLSDLARTVPLEKQLGS